MCAGAPDGRPEGAPVFFSILVPQVGRVMNYYQPRQREKSLRWDFTCKNNKQIWPIGYCSGRSVGGPHDDKYHDDGHASAEEASECYRQYLLDNRLVFEDGEGRKTMRVCQHPECDEFTAGTAEIELCVFHLCDEHRTREVVESLFEAPGQVISS